MRLLFSILFIFILSLSTALSQFINGRLVTSGYSWERYEESGKSSTQFRTAETIQLDFGKDDLVFHSYFQGSNDFGSSVTDDPRLRFYNLYLEKKNLFGSVDVKVGRIPIFSGMGIGGIDGAALKYKPLDGKVVVNGYFGGLLPVDQSLKLTKDFDKNFMTGFQVSTSYITNTSVTLGYMMRHRKPQSFYALRTDTMFSTYEILIENNAEQEQYGTLDLNYSQGMFTAYGKTDYDLNLWHLYRGELNLRYNLDRTIGLAIDYMHREPRTAYNSIFSVFTQKNTDEIGGGIDYLLMNKYNLFARYSFVSYEDENTSRLTIGTNCSMGAFSYSRNFGYIGDLDALSLDMLYPLMERKIILQGGISYVTYKYKEDEQKAATSIILGASYKPSRTISCDLQGQMMFNDVYKNDFRIYFKFGYSFLSKLNIL
jgi:hypothetical protein